MHYRPEVDGLRALAVVAVIANHFGHAYLPNGYLGVDIFFVISGHVITASLYERGGQGLGGLLIDFYVRRVKRLLPALVLFVLLSSVLISLVNPAPEITLKTGLAALFGLSNLYLIRQATDYFGDAAQLNAFTHTWSLGVEEQFYLLFPFIVWLTGFRRHGGGRTWVFYTVMGMASLASLAAFVHFNATVPDLVYYLMPTRLWELGAGSFAFWLTQRPGASGPADGRVKAGAVLVFLLTLAAMAVPAPSGVLAISATLLAVAMIWLVRPGTLPHAVLTNKAVVHIGLISYSLYLWHWTVLALSRWSIGIHWWTIPVQVTLMLLLAVLSYRWVEKPLRHVSWSSAKWPTIAYGLGASAFAAMLMVVLIKPLDGRLYAGHRPPLSAAGTGSLAWPYTFAGKTWDAGRCVLADDSEVGKTITPEGCTLGDFQKARTRVLVIGNSHAAAFTHAFEDMVRSDRFAVTLTSSWGASPIGEVPNHSFWRKANDYYWRTTVPALVSQLRPGDWVLLLSDLARFMPPGDLQPAHRQELAQLKQGLERFSGELSRGGIRLAMLHGLPHAREANCDPAAAMTQWFSPFGGPCKFLGKALSLQRRAGLERVLGDVAARHGLVTIDLFDLFCPGEVCNYQALDGTFMYRDVWSHPSVEAARMSEPAIREALHARPARMAVLQARGERTSR